MLKLDCVQWNPTVGDLDSQVKRLSARLRTTVGDIVVTPECYLTGYPLQDLVTRPGFLRRVERALSVLSDVVVETGKALLVGAPVAGADLPYNAAVLLTPDGGRQVTFKTELPNNDVFDERRTFARGDRPVPLVYQGVKLGVMICEDMWHAEVANRLAGEGADLFIVINGSPMEKGKNTVRQKLARAQVDRHGLPLLYLNLVGGQDELVFDGASFILDKSVDRPSYFKALEEQEAVIQFVPARRVQGFPARWMTLGQATLGYAPLVQLSAVGDGEEPYLYKTLVLGMRDYIEKNGFTSVVLGLSGGLDSALVAAIAVDALGPDRVWTVMMPATYTGSESLSLAEDMAQRLGCRHAVVAVQGMVDQAASTLSVALAQPGLPVNANAKSLGVANENLQARARGQLLMALSNANPGLLVLSTGNKSEMSVGYATLYGDMCGGFNPIKDLYKTEVQNLARWRNAVSIERPSDFREVLNIVGGVDPIPERIISRPPTAELAAEQTDEASLGAYEVLDAVLRGMIERSLPPHEALRQAQREVGDRAGLDLTYVQKIAKLLKIAEYKRRQAPPGIKVSGRSFGFGWRYPITSKGPLDEI